MNYSRKTLIRISIIILLVIVGGFIFVNYTKTENTPVEKHSMIQRSGPHVVYTRAGGDIASPKIEMVIANLKDGKKEVVWTLQTHHPEGYLHLIPEKDSVIFLDANSNKVKLFSLITESEEILYDNGNEYYINDIALSADKTQIALAMHTRADPHYGKVVGISLIDKSVKTLVEKTDYPVNTISLWDTQGRLVLSPSSEKDCGYGIAITYDKKGNKINNSIYSKTEYATGRNLPSHDYNYIVSAQEKKGQLVQSEICGNYAHGTLALYSVADGKKEIIESDTTRQFVPYRWSENSSIVIYKVEKGHLSLEGYSVFEFENYIAYDTETKQKIVLHSIEEVQEFLTKRYPQELVFIYPESTDAAREEDKNLYLNGKVFDSVNKLQWSMGPAVFNILGVIQ